MTELEEQNVSNEGTPPPNQEDPTEGGSNGKVYVGFHQLGGVRLVSDDVRLDPNEAFALAGQLIAHATLAINFGYMAQAQAEEQLLKGVRSIALPPGVTG